MIRSINYGGFTHRMAVNTIKIPSIGIRGSHRSIPLTDFPPGEQTIMVEHMLRGQDITYLERADIMLCKKYPSTEKRNMFGRREQLLLLGEVYKYNEHKINIIYAEPDNITTVTLNHEFYFELPERRSIRGFVNRREWHPRNRGFLGLAIHRLNRPLRPNGLIIRQGDPLVPYYTYANYYSATKLEHIGTGEMLIFSSVLAPTEIDSYLHTGEYAIA